MLTGLAGYYLVSFLNHAFERHVGYVICGYAFFLSALIVGVNLPSPKDYTFVSTQEMVSICREVEHYPELWEALRRILCIRPVLTEAEYERFELAADCLATEEAWAAVKKRLRCGDSTA